MGSTPRGEGPVRLTATARRQVRDAWAWWVLNRPAASGLFARELRFALELLRQNPRIGAPYEGGVRRVVMAKTRYEIFYEYDPTTAVLAVLGLWSSRRHTKPLLR